MTDWRHISEDSGLGCRSTSIDGALWFIELRYDLADRPPALMYFTATRMPSQRTAQTAPRGCLSADNDDLRWFLSSWWEPRWCVGRRGPPLNTEPSNEWRREFALTATGLVASGVTLNRLRYSAPTAAAAAGHSHPDHTIRVHIVSMPACWKPGSAQVAAGQQADVRPANVRCTGFSSVPPRPNAITW